MNCLSFTQITNMFIFKLIYVKFETIVECEKNRSGICLTCSLQKFMEQPDMSSVRQQNFILRKEKILAMAETLLLDNNQDITLSELACELDIAKGTIYKHFKSKNQLYLELIILNEKRLLEISKKYNHDIKTYVSQYMLYNMLNSNRTILLHVIEERLTNNERKTQRTI